MLEILGWEVWGPGMAQKQLGEIEMAEAILAMQENDLVEAHRALLEYLLIKKDGIRYLADHQRKFKKSLTLAKFRDFKCCKKRTPTYHLACQ
jgi:hypothetical protein